LGENLRASNAKGQKYRSKPLSPLLKRRVRRQITIRVKQSGGYELVEVERGVVTKALFTTKADAMEAARLAAHGRRSKIGSMPTVEEPYRSELIKLRRNIDADFTKNARRG
jgi:hypothetical protein